MTIRKKRYRRIDAKPNELKVAWGMGEWPDTSKDLQYAWGAGTDMKPTIRCIMNAFEGVPCHDGKSMRAILEERGFDIETLKFSIMKKM